MFDLRLTKLTFEQVTAASLIKINTRGQRCLITLCPIQHEVPFQYSERRELSGSAEAWEDKGSVTSICVYYLHIWKRARMERWIVGKVFAMWVPAGILVFSIHKNQAQFYIYITQLWRGQYLSTRRWSTSNSVSSTFRERPHLKNIK